MKFMNIADVFAIPFWVFAAYYFYKIEKKTSVEIILYVWCIAGLFVDGFFTIAASLGRTI